MTVIYHLWLRELRRCVRLKAQVVVSVVQPLIFLLVFGYGLAPVFRSSGQGSSLDFITPGTVAMAVVFSSLFSGAQLIWERQFGFLKEMMVAPAPRAYIMIGRTSGAATAAVIPGLLIMLISVVAGFRPASPAGIPLALGFIALIGLVSTALSTIIGTTLNDMQGHQMIVTLVAVPLLFLSGALFPLEHLPRLLTAVTVMDPFSYAIDGLRGALTGRWHFKEATDVATMAILLAITTWYGTVRFSRIRI